MFYIRKKYYKVSFFCKLEILINDFSTYFHFRSAAKFDHERGGGTDGREDDHCEMGGHGEGGTNRRVQGHCVGQLQQGADHQRFQ